MEISIFYFLCHTSVYCDRGYLTNMLVIRHSIRLLYVSRYILHMMQCVRFSLVSFTCSTAQRQDYSFKSSMKWPSQIILKCAVTLLRFFCPRLVFMPNISPVFVFSGSEGMELSLSRLRSMYLMCVRWHAVFINNTALVFTEARESISVDLQLLHILYKHTKCGMRNIRFWHQKWLECIRHHRKWVYCI